MDDILKNYTASQKKALILEVYLRQRMHYSYTDDKGYQNNRNSNAYLKKLYNGTFKGACGEGAAIAYDICQYLGIKAYFTRSHEMNHAWCGIFATDKNGTSYYHGIYTTSYPYSMKASIPAKYNNNPSLSESQVKKYLCSPNAATYFHALQRRIKNSPTRKPAPTTAPSVTTQAPAATPAPTPKPSPTTTTVIFNTPEPPEPDDTPTPAATTEPTKAPVATQEPSVTTQAPIVTPEPEPTVEPTPEPTPAPTETPVPQRIMIPHAEHGYTCPGCNVPYRHKNVKNPYITNGSATSGDITVYKHYTSEGIRYFDADGNEYIDINKNGNIMDELALLQE